MRTKRTKYILLYAEGSLATKRGLPVGDTFTSPRETYYGSYQYYSDLRSIGKHWDRMEIHDLETGEIKTIEATIMDLTTGEIK